MTRGYVDVLICSHNDAGRLSALLGSLRAQSVGADAFRIVFVDNGSTDNTREVVERERGGLNLLYVLEPKAGKSHASKTGYRNTTAPFVAHIDSDCIADANWLLNITRIIEAYDPDVIAGEYEPYYETPKPVWFLDRYNSRSLGPVGRWLDDKEYVNGANMVWRKSVVEQAGGFLAGLGIAGAGIVGGEDTNLLVRARRKILGLKVYASPDVRVRHFTRPRMMRVGYFLRRSFLLGLRSSRIFECEPVWRSVALFRAIRDCLVLLAMPLRMLVRDREEFPHFQNYLVECGGPLVSDLGTNLFGILSALGAGRKTSAG